MREKVLALDGDPFTRSLLHHLLTTCGYDVVCIEQREAILELIGEQKPHLLLLEDLTLCALIRQQWPHLPMIILSTVTEERQKVRALDLGADDYITWPFDHAEFLARVRAHLRRSQLLASRSFCKREPDVLASNDGYISMDRAHRVVHVGGQTIRLTKTEFELLWQLMLHEGKVLTHSMLLNRVWGAAYTQEAGYLHVYIYHLRWKLEEEPAHPRYILTETRIGYKFQSPQEESIKKPCKRRERQPKEEDERYRLSSPGPAR